MSSWHSILGFGVGCLRMRIMEKFLRTENEKDHPILIANTEARFLEIGKYWEISAMELLARLNTKTTPMSLLDIYLLQPHWKKMEKGKEKSALLVNFYFWVIGGQIFFSCRCYWNIERFSPDTHKLRLLIPSTIPNATSQSILGP